MKGMGQIVSWSVRDESLHCEGMVQLYHAFNAETGAVTKSVQGADIVDCCKTVVAAWKTASSTWPSRPAKVQGMTPDDIKTYIRFIADWRLRQLKPARSLRREGKPLPWLQSLAIGRSRTRQLLRGPRDRVLLEGRHHRLVAGRPRRVGRVRPDVGEAGGRGGALGGCKATLLPF